jgi:carbamoyl-phosphate synthase large subunit
MASHPSYLEFVIDLCRQQRFDVVVPGVDEELLQLAQGARDLYPTRLLLPGEQFIATMLDKLEFVSFMERNGLRGPVTKRLDESEDWRSFPCIVKPRTGRGSRGVSTVMDESELSALRFGLGPKASGYIAQELLLGSEYSVQVIADQQSVVRAVFPARILVKRGITISAVSELSPEVTAACISLHRAFPTVGCYNVQGILSPHGAFVPFEVNPRVSTTLCLAVAAGIDPIALFLSEDHSSGLIDFEVGLGLERYWSNHFSSRQERL